MPKTQLEQDFNSVKRSYYTDPKAREHANAIAKNYLKELFVVVSFMLKGNRVKHLKQLWSTLPEHFTAEETSEALSAVFNLENIDLLNLPTAAQSIIASLLLTQVHETNIPWHELTILKLKHVLISSHNSLELEDAHKAAEWLKESNKHLTNVPFFTTYVSRLNTTRMLYKDLFA